MHLSEFLSMCTIFDRVDLASTTSTRDVHRDFHPVLLIMPRVLQSKKTKTNSPTRRKLLEFTHLKCRTDVTVNLNPKYWMLICTISLIIQVNINNTCHIRATQALVRVRVALPYGPKCHVASTWARAKKAPFSPF